MTTHFRYLRRTASLLAVTAHLALWGSLSAEPQRIDGIAATVNGRVISISEVKSTVTAQKQVWRTVMAREDSRLLEAKMKQIEEEALDALINRELILAEFKKMEAQGAGIKEQYVDEDIARIVLSQFGGDEDAFLEELARTGMSIRKFRELRREILVVQFMRQLRTPDIPPPTPAEVEAYYKENRSEFTGEAAIKLRTITVPKYLSAPGSTPATQKKLAEDLRAQINGGADFASIAKAYSKDPQADQGGDRGTIRPKDISPGISAVAFAMKPKTVSQVLDTSGAYVILYVEARQEGPLTPLDEVRAQIENRIRGQKGKDLQEEWLERLRKDAVIRRFD